MMDQSGDQEVMQVILVLGSMAWRWLRVDGLSGIVRKKCLYLDCVPKVTP